MVAAHAGPAGSVCIERSGGLDPAFPQDLGDRETKRLRLPHTVQKNFYTLQCYRSSDSDLQPYRSGLHSIQDHAGSESHQNTTVHLS